MTETSTAFVGRRIVITGGAGLIGSRLAKALAGVAAAITIIDSMVPEHGGNTRNLADVGGTTFVRADVADRDATSAALEGADVVFNLAGQRSHTDSMQAPLTDLHHNCYAQLAFLEACRVFAPDAVIVFSSTRQVYGRVTRIPADESEAVAPRDVNGINKAAAERYHRLYFDIHGLRTIVLRLTNTFGPGMRVRDARQGFLGAWLGALVRGEEFEVWGGMQVRDLNYVDDVVDALLLTAAEPRVVGGTFNLGGEPISLGELADVVVAANGGGSYRMVPLPDEARAIDIGDYAGDFGALQRLTGWTPRTPLADGLRTTLEYLRANREHYL